MVRAAIAWGGVPLRRPCGPGTYNTFFLLLEKHPCFCSSSRTSAAKRREIELLPPRSRRKGVLWAPLGELRAPVLLRTNELLWLPRSARRADGDETRSRAKSGEQVVEQIGTRLSAAHFVHADRSYQTLEAKIRLRQAAGLFRSPLLFLAQGAPKQSPRTNQRR